MPYSFKRSTETRSPIRKRARVPRRTYNCKNCIRTFGSYKDLQSHARSHAGQQASVDDDVSMQDVSDNSETSTTQTNIDDGLTGESIDGNNSNS